MKSHVRCIALAAMMALAACGDDDGVTPGDLSQTEAEALATAIFQQSFISAFGIDTSAPAQAPDGPALATYSGSAQNTFPCPLGGEVANAASFDVDVDDQTGAGTVDFSVDQTHSACVVQSDDGMQFTLNGNPGVAFDFLMETDGDQNFGFSGSMTGAISWATEGKDGSCSVSMEFTGEGSPNGFSFSNGGTVCGVQFSEQFSFSAG